MKAFKKAGPCGRPLNETRIMSTVRHVVWDWNGTLLDDVQACVDAINILLERRGLPLVSREQYLEVFDFPVRNYYLRIGFNLEQENWHSLAVEYHEAYARTSAGCRLRDGALPVLESMRQSGITLSVLSACELSLLRRMMEERGILGYFDHVYGLSDLYAHSKVTLGHSLLAQAGLTPDSTLLVGDTTHDYEVASALGLPCLLLSGGHQAAEKLRRCRCPLVADIEAVHLHVCTPCTT